MRKADSSLYDVKILGYLGIVASFVGYMMLPCLNIALKYIFQVKLTEL
jgi:hypothetical protein